MIATRHGLPALGVAGILLFGAAPAAGQPAAPGAPQVQTLQAAQTHGTPQAASEQSQHPTLRISGFADINFSETKIEEGPQGFSLGQLTLHLASSLSPRVTFFGEISFTARGDAGTGSPQAAGYNVELERMILRYDQSDQLKLSVGRYHTPINWWNTAYHHGSWLQTTISRPEMIRFGGQYMPVHFVGGLVEGVVPAGGWNLNYKGGVGNGRGSVISRGGDAGDNNGSRAWLANAFLKPDQVFGLEFGGAAYGDTVTLSSGGTVDEAIVSGYAVWSKEDPEIITEVSSVRHRDTATGLVTWNHAWYVQVAYRLPAFNAVLKPYYRFEHIGINDADVMFATVPNLDGSTAGLRWDVSPYAAIKVEYRTWRRAETPRNHGGFFQVCFTF